MEKLILIIAVILETGFAAYCIATKSSQKKIRNWMRVSAFTTFVLLALLSIIHWGFTWYLLAALLFIWAILGAWGLLRRKPVSSPTYPA